MTPRIPISLATIILALSVWPGRAADQITIPTSTDAALSVHDQAGFDWSGFYAGIYGSVRSDTLGNIQAGPGLQIGVNAQFDFYLVGGEIAVQGLGGGAGETIDGQILARAGLAISDNVMLYAAGGYGLDLGAPADQDVLAGGGVELAISDSLSLRAQYLRGFSLSGAGQQDQFSLGANFHF